MSDQLRRGLETLDPGLVEALRTIMPPGSYQASLLRVAPQLVQAGDAADYFSHEQLRVWAKPVYWFLPHDPKTHYYRCASQSLSPSNLFFEFIVPLLPLASLRQDTLTDYTRRLAAGEQPTALALSVLDTREPVNVTGDSLRQRHWCLVHYLLDGHHKLHSAALTGRAITLLSFLNYNWSSSVVFPILDALAGHPRDPDDYDE